MALRILTDTWSETLLFTKCVEKHFVLEHIGKFKTRIGNKIGGPYAFFGEVRLD
jgi:hypothetical protein